MEPFSTSSRIDVAVVLYTVVPLFTVYFLLCFSVFIVIIIILITEALKGACQGSVYCQSVSICNPIKSLLTHQGSVRFRSGFMLCLFLSNQRVLFLYCI